MFAFSEPLERIMPPCLFLVNVLDRKLDVSIGKENGRQEVSGLLFVFLTHSIYKLSWCKASYFWFLFLLFFFQVCVFVL